MPPSNRMLAVESQMSATEAEMEELKERRIEAEAVIEDYGRKSRNIMKSIAEYLKEYQTVKDSKAAHCQLEVLQNEIVALEKKLISVTEAKDDEIKSCKIRLRRQRIKLTTEHKAICEQQERNFMKRLRETEGMYQKALRSAESQHVAELRSKNQKLERLESKVQKLEAQLSVRQSSVQNKLKDLFKRKKSVSVDGSKRRSTAQKDYRGGELKSDSERPIHQTKEHDQDSHVSTISPPFSYDQYSLHSLPAMHFREIREQDQDQPFPYYASSNQVASPQKAEDSSKGSQSDPEDDDIAISLNPRMDSTTTAV